jgi:ArsR family transcriptional regulator
MAVKSVDSLTTLFGGLSDPTRLRILNLIRNREVCVCYFVEALQVPQSKISRHLGYLRKAGLVSARRQGKWMHYRLREPANPRTAAVLNAALACADEMPAARQDRARFDSACSGKSRMVVLRGAPIPKASCHA